MQPKPVIYEAGRLHPHVTPANSIPFELASKYLNSAFIYRTLQNILDEIHDPNFDESKYQVFFVVEDFGRPVRDQAGKYLTVICTVA